MPKLPGFGDEPGDEPQLPQFPEELRVSRAEDPIAFLRVVAVPTKVAVGEQVTLRIYAYGGRGPFREANTSEPSREAFLAQTLLENSYTETMYRVPVGGEVWYAKKVREIALFPIRAGELTVGSMRMGFDGRGYPSSSQHRGLERLSPPIVISASEPPLAGRPPGYKVGDVGRFTLSANVEPREIAAGEAVSIVAKLEGTGNLPFELRAPQRTGVQWLEPTTVDEIAPRGTTIGGWRKFTYVVRVDQSGDVDLGELDLPYWDPERESYDVARAKLGIVKVKPATGADSKEPEPNDSLKDAISLRKTLGPGAPPPRRISDESWFWVLLLLAPLGVTLTGQGVSLARRLKHKVRENKESLATQSSKALADALRAANAGDVAKAASAAERAVVTALEGTVGLKARGILREALGKELEARELSHELADEITSLLGDCDDARFTGSDEAKDAKFLRRTSGGRGARTGTRQQKRRRERIRERFASSHPRRQAGSRGASRCHGRACPSARRREPEAIRRRGCEPRARRPRRLHRPIRVPG